MKCSIQIYADDELLDLNTVTEDVIYAILSDLEEQLVQQKYDARLRYENADDITLITERKTKPKAFEELKDYSGAYEIFEKDNGITLLPLTATIDCMLGGKQMKRCPAGCMKKSAKGPKKSPKRSKGSKGCSNMSHLKKYRSRPSPAYPANKCCNKMKTGNDGNLYRSVRNRSGICQWKRA